MNAVGILTTALRRPQTYVGVARELASAARCAALYPAGLAEHALRTGTPRGDAVGRLPVRQMDAVVSRFVHENLVTMDLRQPLQQRAEGQ